MSKRPDAKGRRKGGGQFVPISYNMARSDAWRSLSGAAAKVYAELRSRYNGYNNGQMSLSFAEAAALLALGKSTVGRAFGELEEKGFIRKTKQGEWYGRKASEWSVSDKPLQTGEPATNDWQAWRYPKTDPRYSGGTMRSVASRLRTRGGENF